MMMWKYTLLAACEIFFSPPPCHPLRVYAFAYYFARACTLLLRVLGWCVAIDLLSGGMFVTCYYIIGFSGWASVKEHV